MPSFQQWEGFSGRNWKSSVDVRDFIQHNYTPYEGNEDFLEEPTEATNKLWGRLQELQKCSGHGDGSGLRNHCLWGSLH